MKIRYIILLSLLTFNSYAQLKEFEINEMARPDVPLVQANADFPDNALLLVYSSLDNLSFRSSMNAINRQVYNSRAGRYEVLMKPVKHIIFVSKIGFIEAPIATLNPSAKEIFQYKIEVKNPKLIESIPPLTNYKLAQDEILSAINENEYTIVSIGNQLWMAENLNVDKFRNGDPIPQAKTKEEWERAGKNKHPAWSYYDNDPAYGPKYGKLYNWFAVNDPRGLAPKGWHVPSDKEWTMLTDFLGKKNIVGSKMKNTTGWKNQGNGNNSSGFSGLPGGYRGYYGLFDGFGQRGNWWSSTENYTYVAWSRYLYYSTGNALRTNYNKHYGFSVRCLRD